MAIAAKARGNIHKGLIAATKHRCARSALLCLSGGKDASRSVRRRIVSLICQDCVKSRQDETEAKISMTASSCFTTREQL